MSPHREVVVCSDNSWMACTDVHLPLRMSRSHCGDPVTFHLVAPSGDKVQLVPVLWLTLTSAFAC